MTPHYVPDFVGDHPRQFRFGVRYGDEAPIDVEKAAGKGKGVDFIRIHDFYVVVYIGPFGMPDEGLPQLVDVADHLRVREQFDLSFDFSRKLAAERYFIRLAEDVEILEGASATQGRQQ